MTEMLAITNLHKYNTKISKTNGVSTYRQMSS